MYIHVHVLSSSDLCISISFISFQLLYLYLCVCVLLEINGALLHVYIYIMASVKFSFTLVHKSISPLELSPLLCTKTSSMYVYGSSREQYCGINSHLRYVANDYFPRCPWMNCFAMFSCLKVYVHNYIIGSRKQ